jgi:hypothetical protein
VLPVPAWIRRQPNFHVALVDDMLRQEHHNETVGLLVSGTKNDRGVRYSLGRCTSPMAVSAYTYDNSHQLNSERRRTKDPSWSPTLGRFGAGTGTHTPPFSRL